MDDRVELTRTFPQADARNAILEAALTVFAAEGFHGATTRGIAQAAGVSQPLLNHHFGGKDALWRLVGERTAGDFLAYMAETVDLALTATPSAQGAQFVIALPYQPDMPPSS